MTANAKKQEFLRNGKIKNFKVLDWTFINSNNKQMNMNIGSDQFP